MPCFDLLFKDLLHVRQHGMFVDVPCAVLHSFGDKLGPNGDAFGPGGHDAIAAADFAGIRAKKVIDKGPGKQKNAKWFIGCTFTSTCF